MTRKVKPSFACIGTVSEDTLQLMSPRAAWGYAASWGSMMTGGDPGACMYGFDERFTVQSEQHRADAPPLIYLPKPADIDQYGRADRIVCVGELRDAADYDNHLFDTFAAAVKAAGDTMLTPVHPDIAATDASRGLTSIAFRDVQAAPGEYESDELDQLAALRAAIEAAPVAANAG